MFSKFQLFVLTFIVTDFTRTSSIFHVLDNLNLANNASSQIFIDDSVLVANEAKSKTHILTTQTFFIEFPTTGNPFIVSADVFNDVSLNPYVELSHAVIFATTVNVSFAFTTVLLKKLTVTFQFVIEAFSLETFTLFEL
jgi:hypothetical protein